MSGICGIYAFDASPISQHSLAGMLDQLAHRGPDGVGLWHEGSIGLGHRMLFNTPESLHETLPLVHRSQRWVITSDARIDNREELANRLGLAADRSLSSLSDSELILEAYVKWGERCLDYLLGDFAFAIWNEPGQRLFLARDHFGVKPLYYYSDRHIFAFATEIKALFQLPEVSRQLNLTKVADYLAALFEDTAITFYENIVRLPAAQQLQVTSRGVDKQSYWQLDPEKEIVFASDNDYAEALKEQFETAVRCRLRSAYPVGSMLSGGLDSSSIACVARNLLIEQNKPSLKTFSAIFQQIKACDESDYIQAVVEQGNIEPHYLHADRISPLANLKEMFWHQDEAFYAPNLFIHWGLYQKASDQKVRTVLDGFDGDTTISHGLPYISELAERGKWIALLKEVRGFSINFNRPLGPLLWKYFWQQGLEPRSPHLVQRAVKRMHRQLFPPKSYSLSLQADFAQQVNIEERIRSVNYRVATMRQSARMAHAQRLSWGVLPFTLEVADKAAAAHRIEPRFPFFDKRLVEFCLAIPPEQKISNGWTRVVMRRAMNNILPTKVQWRSGKSDLSPGYHYGLRELERDCLERVLREDTALIEPYLDIALLRQTYQRFIAEEKMIDSDVISIWKPVTLALWLKQADFTHSV